MVATLRASPAQTAVRPSLVVKVDPSADAGAGFRASFVSVQVHVLVFEWAPEAFDKYVVQPAAPAVHGNADSLISQDVGKGKAGKLTALVGVEEDSIFLNLV